MNKLTIPTEKWCVSLIFIQKHLHLMLTLLNLHTTNSKHNACHCLPMGSTDVAYQSGGVEATSNLMTEGRQMNWSYGKEAIFLNFTDYRYNPLSNGHKEWSWPKDIFPLLSFLLDPTSPDTTRRERRWWVLLTLEVTEQEKGGCWRKTRVLPMNLTVAVIVPRRRALLADTVRWPRKCLWSWI